jgi:hypothetical protein
MGRATEDALDELHAAVIQELADRIKKGEAKPADLAVARAMLKDNGINILVKPSSPATTIIQHLEDQPFDEEAEIERQRNIFSGPSAGRA